MSSPQKCVREKELSESLPMTESMLLRRLSTAATESLSLSMISALLAAVPGESPENPMLSESLLMAESLLPRLSMSTTGSQSVSGDSGSACCGSWRIAVAEEVAKASNVTYAPPAMGQGKPYLRICTYRNSCTFENAKSKTSQF